MNIALLGSTGSIGTSTLDVVRKYPDRFTVTGLCAGANIDALAGQILEFRPRLVSLADEGDAHRLRSRLPVDASPEIAFGAAGAVRVATMPEADMIVAAIAGSSGLEPTFAAVQAGKDVALANKESLVMAGALLTGMAEKNSSRIIPVDSEHSAIFQLLRSRSAADDVHKIILTASGGPFLHLSREELARVSPAQALRHPRWKMGKKVTTDSASLMNKGLEIIEAYWLFGVPPERIQVVIHPQSIIHSMVEFIDGSVFAQLSEPDMKGPIAYALSCPERLRDVMRPLNFAEVGTLNFYAPDTALFPALELAYRALRQQGLMPAVMNGANETAVESFHDNGLGFLDMAHVIETVMQRFSNDRELTLDNIVWADAWARREAADVIGSLQQKQS